MAAISRLPVTFIFTHDSIAVGEDGPTHEPVEHLVALRAIPNLVVLRPADANEVAEAYRVALRRTTGPTTIVLTRQKVPTADRTKVAPASGLAKGAYVLSEAAGGAAQVLLIASGSEVGLALSAQEKLAAQGIRARVVSMPSWELFSAQDSAYRDSVLPPSVRARVSIEAGATLGWHRWVGDGGVTLGIDRFGASGNGDVLMEKFGFTVDNVVAVATRLVKA
jgi:transketolase